MQFDPKIKIKNCKCILSVGNQFIIQTHTHQYVQCGAEKCLNLEHVGLSKQTFPNSALSFLTFNIWTTD